jgi:hypothetical protein
MLDAGHELVLSHAIFFSCVMSPLISDDPKAVDDIGGRVTRYDGDIDM